MTVPEWRIFYADGSTFDSEQGEPQDAPGWGVVCVVFADAEIGRAVVTGFDYYLFLADGGWIGVMGVESVLDHCINTAANLRAVKAGRMLPRKQYHEVESTALDDPDFPPKSNIRADEKPPR